MFPASRAVVCAAVMALSAIAVTGLSAQSGAELGNSRIRIKVVDNDGGYERPRTASYEALRTRLMKRSVLEDFARFLSPLRLPHMLWLRASECKEEGASPHYSPGDHMIDMCYQFLESMEEQASRFAEIAVRDPKALPLNISRDEAMDGVYVSVLLHETGHALFDLLDVPIFGREEDAADAIAAFIALQFDNETARTLVKGFASYWLLQNNPPTKAMDPQDPNFPKDDRGRCIMDPFCRYADEHGTSGQRLYNILCVAYGGNPGLFQDFVDLGWLPKQRASTCKAEYEQVRHSFEKTVYPFIDQDLMKKVRSIQWLKVRSR